MKYIALITIFFASHLSAIDRLHETPTTYWIDPRGHIIMEIEGHEYEVTPLNHSIECHCNWAD
jgi:hypothetical protein